MMMRFICILILAFCLCACEKPLADDLDEAKAALVRMDWGQAEKLLERSLRTETKVKKRWKAWNLLLEAAGHVDNGNIPEYLEAMLLEFADDTSKKKDILIRLADLRESSRQYEQAISALHKLSLAEPDTDTKARINRRMGHLFLKLHQFSMAEEKIHACLDLKPAPQIRASCLYAQAEIMFIMEKNNEAAGFAQQALDVPEAESAVKGLAGFLLADILEVQGKKMEALQQFEAVRALYPNEMVVDARIEYLRKNQKK